jgi:hypothetical protein
MIREYNKIRPKEDVSKANGIFLCSDYVTNDDIPGKLKSNVLGIMYLNLETLSDETIIHECGHAAFAFERNIRRYTGDYTYEQNNGEYYANGGGEEQEVFC